MDNRNDPSAPRNHMRHNRPTGGSTCTVRAARSGVGLEGVNVSLIAYSVGRGTHTISDHTVIVHTDADAAGTYWRGDDVCAYNGHRDRVLFLAAGGHLHYEYRAAADALMIEVTHEQLTTVAKQVDVDCDTLQMGDALGAVDPVVRGIADAYLDELHRPSLGGELYLETVGTQLTLHLLRRHADELIVDETLRAQRRRLRPVIYHIGKHLSEPLRLDDLAARANLSSSHFSRVFKRVYDVSPYQYILRRRLEIARQLIMQGAPVTDVALQLGFSDHSHLTRHYKKFFGVTPYTHIHQRGS